VSELPLDRRRLWARLASHPVEKLAVWLGLAVGICVPYFTLQQISLFPLRTVPETLLDRWVPFQPAFIWPYVSIALLVPLAPALATSREALRRYATGLALLCLPCFVIFAVFPVLGPRPGAVPDHSLYAWIVSVDRPSNSMPSLHAGLVVYSFLFGLRALRGGIPPAAFRAVALTGVCWAALIFYATLATKQHWAWDLPVGALLACGGHALAWRAADRDAARRSLPITTG
jgi:hypothetical protein